MNKANGFAKLILDPVLSVDNSTLTSGLKAAYEEIDRLEAEIKRLRQIEDEVRLREKILYAECNQLREVVEKAHAILAEKKEKEPFRFLNDLK
ncbi:MAG: hypothetical protein SGI74_12995 [Oligoflexia bacterium]|nr:hypothetical protein [Oligoflexia bacterium]